MADDKRRDDEVGLPLPPTPPPQGDPRVHPAAPPTFAPEPPPDFKSRRVDASDAPPDDPSREWYGRMPHGPPPPPSRYRALVFVISAIMIALFGFLGLLLLRPASPHVAQGTSVTGTEQTIELPTGQHLISAEIGQHGEVYYRYTPLQPGEQPRNSTVEGRWSDGSSTGKIHFIERTAE